MDSFLEIQKAMAKVPDMVIDPTTGATLHKSNKSILENTGVELTDNLKKEIEKQNEKDEEKKEQIKSVSSVYRQMLSENKPIERKPLDVGKLDNEEDFMDTIIKKLGKRK